MPGDISRDTAPRARAQGYSRVLMQQGRVQLDADWNEQAELTHHRDRTLARDAFGACGVPAATPDAFLVVGNSGGEDFSIEAGRLYVDGLLVENDRPRTYGNQPFLPDPDPLEEILPDADAIGLVFLEVFEHHVSAAEDDGLRERALGGPDTTTRAQTVWQVRVMPLADTGLSEEELLDRVRKGQPLDIPAWLPPTDQGGLQARVDPAATGPEERPCLLPPEAGFLGLENQLYRVQVHRSGTVNGSAGDAPTYKWSRENASILARVSQGSGGLELEQDPRVGEDDFATGAWVELIDRAREFARQPGPLAQIRRPSGRIALDPEPPGGIAGLDNPRLRRWDQLGASPTPDGVPVTGGFDDLEDGIQVRFAPGSYRSGDYWLIPARTATGAIEWPPTGPAGDLTPVPPLGGDVHFCPLALFTRTDAADRQDLRVRFRPLINLGADQPSILETVTVAPILMPVDRSDSDEETTSWGNGIGFAFTRTDPGNSRRVDGVMPIQLSPRGRIRTIRLLGSSRAARGELEFSLLRFAIASVPERTLTAEQTVASVQFPISPGPFDERADLESPHQIDTEGFRYVLRALATRSPNTGSFVSDDIQLYSLQITYVPG